MPAAVRLRMDFSAGELRRLAATTKNANQSRRLLSLAAVLDGMSRTEAARIGGMDRQTLRDWVHRFNQHGPEGLKDTWSKGHPPRLSAAQQAELSHLVETGPDRAVHGVVRWRRIDLKQIIAERFGVVYHERTVGKILHRLGFSHISARPRHPAQDERIVAEFKKTRLVKLAVQVGVQGHADRLRDRGGSGSAKFGCSAGFQGCREADTSSAGRAAPNHRARQAVGV